MTLKSETTARPSTWRLVIFLAGMALLAIMTLSTWSGTAQAASDPVITYPPGNPTCADINPLYTRSFKIDTGALQNKTYTAADPVVVIINWAGQEITISGLSADGQTFNWSSVFPVDAVLVKAGVNNNALYTYVPAVTSDTGLTKGPDQQNISHLLFCGKDAVPTPTPTPPQPGTFQVIKLLDLDGDIETDDWVPGEGWTFEIDVVGGTPDQSAVVTAEDGAALFEVDFDGDTATVSISEVPDADFDLIDVECVEFLQDGVLEIDFELAGTTATFEAQSGAAYACIYTNTSGEVEEQTATPKVTLPPTDGSTGPPTSGTGMTFVVVLLAVGAFVTSVALMTPVPARIRRRIRQG